ncbi:uncharacterized protein ACIQIH_000015 isoform 1-T1 [Cyanocitta cristata]
MAQDICSSPGHGDLPAPALQMHPAAAQEGEQVLVWCIPAWKSPVTQIIFCKDGVQVHSLKAQKGKGSYYMLFTMTTGSAGTFSCGYQHKDNSNRVRNSALSASQNLHLTGAAVMAQDICSSPGHGDPPAPVFQMSPAAAQEGEQVLVRCITGWKSPVTQIIFCKDGVQVHSLKAQKGKGSYYMLFTMTTGSAGTFSCGYQHKDNSNRVRNSALSASQNLRLTGAAVMAQDICSSPGHGDLQAPSLFLNTSAVQEGEQVLFRCQIFPKSPATQIIFCKDGVQVHSLKAQQGKGSYYMLFTVMSGSAGTFTCGYQHKDNSNRVRNSALSAPTNLSVTGSGSSSQAGTSTAGITPTDLQTNCRDITIGLVVISLLLLAATTYSFVRKGACRERCQRQQQVPSHEAEVTEDNEIQYSTIAHVGHKRPGRQELISNTEYAPVRPSRSQPR